MSDRVTDIVVSVWVLAAGVAFLLLTVGALQPEATEEAVATGRGLYAICFAILLLATALPIVRRFTRKRAL